MLIEQEDNLKKWLNIILEPLSEADPDALSKYVIALIKKDKPKEEIISILLEQLEIFLQKDTKYFVDLLFTTLENKHYIMTNDKEFVQDSSPKKRALSTESDTNQAMRKNPKTDQSNGFVKSEAEPEGNMRPFTPMTPAHLNRGKFYSNFKRKSTERRPFYKRSQNSRRRRPGHYHRGHTMHQNDDQQESYYDGMLMNSHWPRKSRCNDFDLKGYCMRGDLCPYDHGNNPVILKDKGNPTGYPFWCQEISPNFTEEGVKNETEIMEYNPTNPSITTWSENKTQATIDSGNVNSAINKKNSQNTALGLKKIPNHLNTIDNLTKHFSKFGKIMNIHILFEGDPQAALIIFSSHKEAKAAYTATEPVLNNRFIKVFWYNNPIPPIASKVTTPTKSTIYIPTTKITLEPPKVDQSEPTKVATNNPQDQNILFQFELYELYTNRKEANKRLENKKALMLVNEDIINKQYALLNKQLQETQKILDKLKKSPINKEELYSTLKSLQEDFAATKHGINNCMKKSREFKNSLIVIDELNKKITDVENERKKLVNESKDTTSIDNELILLLRKFTILII